MFVHVACSSQAPYLSFVYQSQLVWACVVAFVWHVSACDGVDLLCVGASVAQGLIQMHGFVCCCGGAWYPQAHAPSVGALGFAADGALVPWHLVRFLFAMWIATLQIGGGAPTPMLLRSLLAFWGLRGATMAESLLSDVAPLPLWLSMQLCCGASPQHNGNFAPELAHAFARS